MKKISIFMSLFYYSMTLMATELSVISVIGNAYDIEKGEKISSENLIIKPITISVSKNSRIMLKDEENSLFFHIGSGSLITLTPHKVFIDRGLMLIGSSDNKLSLKISSFSSSTSITGSGFMFIEGLENDGLKLIGLSGKIRVGLESKNQGILAPGQVHFISPNLEEFGTSVNIDLLKFCKSSLLITGFEESISTHLDDLNKAARHQRKKIKKRFNAIVGGMNQPNSFEVIVIEPDKD
tara:strand:+ start:1697 stop:2410 length:714 start_codon:yes stop_codon:yes gene_type:complete